MIMILRGHTGLYVPNHNLQYQLPAEFIRLRSSLGNDCLNILPQKPAKSSFFGIFTVGAEGRLYSPVSALQQNFFGRSRKPQHAFRKYSGIHQASDIYPSGSVWFCPACQNFGKYKVVFENFSYANKGLQASASLSFFACASARSVPFVVK